MAAVENAYTTYDAKANREDLSDTIYNIDPFDTPLMTAAGRRNVSNVLFEWQTEELPAVDTTAREEGFELVRQESQPTVRQSGVCEIHERDATVSGTQEASNPAGKRSEMAHQMALKGKALKRDMESAFFGSDQAANLTDIRRTRALKNWLATNYTSAGGDGTAADPATNTPVTAGTPADFTEVMLNDTMQQCYEAGAEPSLVFVGPGNKRVISSFVGRVNSRHMIQANKVVNVVSLYASDFGDLKILPTRWIDPADVFIMDPRYYRVAFFRNFQRSKLGKIGDADTNMIVVEAGLQVDNEKAHGYIADTTGTLPAP